MLQSVRLPPTVLEIPYDGRALGGSRRRWPAALAAAVALHLGLALGAYFRLTAPPDLPPAAPIEAIALDLAPQAAAPPRPAHDRPPGPPTEPRLAASAASAPAPTKSPPDPRGYVLPTPLRSAASASELVASKTVSALEASAMPAVPAPPAPAAVAPRTSAALVRNAEATWRGLVLGRLKAFRRYPRRAEAGGQEGRVLMVFRIDRSGAVLDARIIGASGYPLLDVEALATVRRASPMPPPPAEVAGDPVEVTAPVEFFIDRP